MSNPIIIEGIRKTIFGAGAIDQVGQECKALKASRALVVMDRELAKTDIGMRAIESIRKTRVKAVPYPDVTPEPSPALADMGTDLAKKEKVGCIVGVGGGSTMDVAKAIAVLV
ncbi:MAG: iron-containing alcohol dehydrogenase, partial [Proteobacteria bacterium]|nr:iron-containing alcohol dehydrogenase [Pseudomonadota bacterium]